MCEQEKRQRGGKHRLTPGMSPNLPHALKLRQALGSCWKLPPPLLPSLSFSEFKMTYFSLTCGAPYPSRLLWRELQSLLPLHGTRRHLVSGALSAKEIHLKKSTATCLSTNHDPDTRYKPTDFVVGSFMSERLSFYQTTAANCITAQEEVSVHLLTDERLKLVTVKDGSFNGVDLGWAVMLVSFIR